VIRKRRAGDALPMGEEKNLAVVTQFWNGLWVGAIEFETV
jgi:hypothetical protein